METGNLGRQRFDQLTVDPVHETGQNRVRIEAPHAHGPVDHRPVTVDPRRLDGPGDRADAQIDLRGQTPVQPQFLEAGPMPRLQAEEIEKAEIQRLLELVGEIAGQHHAGDVRVDPAPRLTALWPACRLHQRSDQGLVLLWCLYSHGHLPRAVCAQSDGGRCRSLSLLIWHIVGHRGR